MQNEMVWKFDLTMFDGGAGGGAGAGAGAGAGGGDGTAGANTGATQEAAAPATNNRRKQRTNPLANVHYGKQPEQQAAAAQAPETGKETPAAPTEDEWKAAKEKYRDFYQRDTSGIVQERLKNSKQAEETMAKLAPVLEGLGKKYGKEASDVDGIIKAYTDDDSLYEEDAAKAGMSVAAYKQLTQLQADNKARQEREARSLQEQRFEKHIQGLIQQGEALKQQFPDFDLRAEMQNPAFQRLTSPEVGVSVSDAYWLIHRAELEPMAMQVATQRTKEMISQSIQSGAMRPAENGAANVSPALDIRDDPSKWTKKDRDEVRRQARAGRRIIL